MTEQREIPCAYEKKQNLRRICFEEMNDREFLTFTEFYTHSQNMCYFLKSKLWHKETQSTIDVLGIVSKHVAVKLQLAEEQQEELLSQQKIGLELQKEIFEHGNYLFDTLLESRKNVEQLQEEFRTNNNENNRLYLELFSKLSSIQSWILGKYSILTSTIFYIMIIIIYFILTSSRRTYSSRLPLMMLISLNIVIEYLIFVIVSQSDIEISLQDYEISRYNWIIRKILIGLSGIIIIVNMIRYMDLNERNNIILQHQNKQIIALARDLAFIKIHLENVNKSHFRNNNIIMSSVSIKEDSIEIEGSGNSIRGNDKNEENFSMDLLNRQETSTPIEYISTRYNLRRRSMSRISVTSN